MPLVERPEEAILWRMSSPTCSRAVWLLPALALFVGLAAVHAEVRTFVDSSGNLIKGELVTVKGPDVTIKRENGQLITLSAATFSPKDRAYFAAHGTEGRHLLAPEFNAKWKIDHGEWKRDNDKLVGEGDSSVKFVESITPPFTLRFRITVLKGIRPRILLGPIACKNEGYDSTLALYPPGRDAGSFKYEHNQAYQVVLIATQKSVELRIDDKLISTGPGLTQALTNIEFRAGDGWSKGEVAYEDIVLVK